MHQPATTPARKDAGEPGDAAVQQLPLGDIVISQVVTATPETATSEVLRRMEGLRISCVVIVEGARPVGIFTERDAVRLLAQGGPFGQPISELMSSPVVTVSTALDFRQAYQMLTDGQFRHLVVVDESQELVGIVTESDFLQHISSGLLGEQSSVAPFMTHHVVTVEPGDRLADALTLMAHRSIGCVVVVEGERPVGIITERDVVGFSNANFDPAALMVGDLMSRPVTTIDQTMTLDEAARTMKTRNIRRLVVVDDHGRLAGLLTRHDIVKALEGRYVAFLRETIEHQQQALEQARGRLESAERQLLYRSVVDQITDAILVVDATTGKIVEANDRAGIVSGIARGHLIGMQVHEISAAFDGDGPEGLRRLVAAGSSLFETLHRHRNGGWYPVEVSVRHVHHGERDLLVAVARDITERRRAEERLRQAAAVYDATAEGVVITDTRGHIVAVNRAFTDITGYSESEVIGKGTELLESGRHGPGFFDAMWQSIRETGTWQGEVWNRRKNGEIYPEWLTVNRVQDAAGRIINYVGVFSDISLIKRSEAKLDHLAHHDPLTDLPNRLLVHSRIRHAIERARRGNRHLAVLFLDLDRFKTINDSLGHPAGDELLVAIAGRLNGCISEEDTLARHGGDEFIVLMESLERPEDAAALALELLQLLGDPFTLASGDEVYASTSIGISLFPNDGADPDQLIRNADSSMYQAKEAGGTTYRFYTGALTQAAHQRLSLETRLRRALEREELLLHYQPQVDLASGRIIGAEALVRWNSPDEGLVPPDRFIHLAEETGLIVPLGDWVMGAACAQARAWQQAGLPPIRMAVNVSGRQFRQPKLAQRIQEILEQSGLAPNLLEIEITESTLMQQGEQADAALNRLKEMGITLAVDDFGTGYSSLACLKGFAVDKLKIDRSFVKEIPHEPSDMEIASTIIAMARNLNLRVLAEGVETQAQLDFLLMKGCHEGQGYHWSRPMPPEQWPALLRQ